MFLSGLESVYSGPNAQCCSIKAGPVCLSFLELAPVVGCAPSFWCSDTIVGLISTFLQCVMLGSQDCTKLVDMKDEGGCGVGLI